MIIKVPKYVKRVMTDLELNGFEVFVVGGCVRDSIMHRQPNDWDLCTNARAEEVAKLLSAGYGVIPTGIKHGTVTVISENIPLEVTTYRADGEYTDSRHPDNVTFVRDITEDLRRRDFTVNAIAYNEECGIVDVCGGYEDIENKVIRCVGDPWERFNEDALRILRALRFSAVLEFEIDKCTDAAIRDLCGKLSDISAERIIEELKKIILSDKPSRVLVAYKDVFSKILGFEYDNSYAICLDNTPKKFWLRTAMLMYSYFKEKSEPEKEITAKLRGMKLEKKLVSEVAMLVGNVDLRISDRKSHVKLMLKKFGYENLCHILMMKRYVVEASGCDCGDVLRCRSCVQSIVDGGECYSLRQLKINGSVLAKFGVKGCEIGEMLDDILNKVINGDMENDSEVLRKYAERLIQS